MNNHIALAAAAALAACTAMYVHAAPTSASASDWETVLWEKQDHVVQIYTPALSRHGQHVQGLLRVQSLNPALLRGYISDGRGGRTSLANADGVLPADTVSSVFDMDCQRATVVIGRTHYTRDGQNVLEPVDGPSKPLPVNNSGVDNDLPAIYHVLCSGGGGPRN